MQFITDKMILWAACLLLYLISYPAVYSPVHILLFIILTCLCTYTENHRIKLALFLLALGLCQFWPPCLLLMPLVYYDVVYEIYGNFVFLLLIPLFMNFTEYSVKALASLLLLFVLTTFMKHKSFQYLKMKREYNEQRDTSKELSLLQEERNQSLLENQDYEINVATLNERNRISKEIHDNIGHILSRALLQIGALLMITKDETEKEGLISLKTSLSQGMDSIRLSIHNMYDESIDLFTSIETLTKDFTFCPVNFDYDVRNTPDVKLKYAFIAITKEALSNVMKHSDATKVQISLREHPAMYQLIISDNGHITEEKRIKLKALDNSQNYFDGMGVQNMLDRVRGFQGIMNLSADNGFKIFISIPKSVTPEAPNIK